MDIFLQTKAKQQLFVFIMLSVVFLFLNNCAPKKSYVYHVGILSGLNYFSRAADGFKEKLTELGYIEGKNIIYEHHKTDFDINLYRKILNEFVSDKVDLIFVFPTEASQEAKIATKGTNIPIVFTIANIEGTGLVESAGTPGDNITGVRFPGPDIALQRFEILCELVPQAKQIWIPYQRDYSIVESQLQVLYPVAASMNVMIQEEPANDASELKTILDGWAKSENINIDAILFLAEPLCVTPESFKIITEFAAIYNIPVGGAFLEMGDYSTIFGITVDLVNSGKQAAILADKILRGTPAGSIPVVSAKPYFQLNYRLVKKIGLNVNKALLSRANEIIR